MYTINTNIMSFHIDLDTKLVTFCQGSDFKSYVRQAIYDEFIWRDMLTKLNLSNTIDNKLESKIPRLAKDEVERVLPSMLETKILQYIANQFPLQVTKEMGNQMPSYLNNNHTMQKLLEEHKTYILQQLDTAVKEILTKITMDPQYHEVTKYHLDAIDTKGDNKIGEIHSKAEYQSGVNQKKFDNELQLMKQKVNKDLAELRHSLSKISELKNRLKNLEDKTSGDVSLLKWSFMGLTAVMVFIFGVSAIRLK